MRNTEVVREFAQRMPLAHLDRACASAAKFHLQNQKQLPMAFCALRFQLRQITLRDELVAYAVDLVRATRTHEAVLVGAGPRASQSLLLASRAWAALEGRDFVTPDDIKRLSKPVLEHRLILRPEFELEGATVSEAIERILQSVPVPR
jgi:MoxR-like ATPase